MSNSVHRFELESGLTLFVEELHHMPVVAVQAWVGVGSADELLPAEAGISHVIEHMLFKGTARREVGDVALEIEGAGGSLNAWTSFDETVYHMVLPAERWATAVDVLADVLQNSTFDAAELDKEKEVIIEEIRHSENSPSHLASDKLFSIVYGDYAYGAPIIGTRQSVNSFTPDDLRAYCAKWYRPENLTFIIAGDVDPLEVKRELERQFPGTGGARPTRLKPPFTPLPSQAAISRGPFTEAYLNLAMPLRSYDLTYCAQIDLLSMVLGDGESSRLQRVLKHEKKLVLDSYAWAFTPVGAGLFTVGAVLSPENINGAIPAILTELKGLFSIDPEELKKAKINLRAEEVASMQTVQGMAKKRGFFHQVLGDPEGDVAYFNAIEAVTVEQLEERARELFESPRFVSVTLPEESDHSEETLRSMLATRVEAPEVCIPGTSDDFTLYTLDSGVKLLVLEEHSLPFVSFRGGWVGGMLTEDLSHSGISPLLSMLYPRGTLVRSGDDVQRYVESRGGSIMGFAGRNSFGLRLDSLSDTFEENSDLFFETLLAPAFSEPEIESAKERLIEAISAEKDRHSTQTLRLFEQGLYKDGHPYGLNISGEKEAVASFTRKDLFAWNRRHYDPSDLVLCAVGDIDGQRLYDKVSYALKEGRTTENSWELPKGDAFGALSKPLYQKADISQNHIILGVPGVSLMEQERFTLEVMSRILSGQSGRLFLDLRDQQSLAYSVSAFSLEGAAPGYFATYIVTRPEQALRSVQGLTSHLDRLMREAVPTQELERTVRYMTGTHAIGLQRRSALCAAAFFGELYGIGYDSYRHYKSNLEQVTAEDIMRVAKTYLEPSKRLLAVYGPEQVPGYDFNVS